ncbi:MAG: hypothetical protein EOP03_00280 [Proteobacteria bacterium]|nr:MAG: hypothetical protein EOP03_00280 [Pseudomonadota bacterium]
MFWRLTLREIGNTLRGVTDRRIRERDERMSLAWHIEAMARVKKMPKLDSMLSSKKRPAGKKMTAEQIEAVTRSWLTSQHRKK